MNTVKNVYYGFYQRIKKYIDYNWSSNISEAAIKLYRSGLNATGCFAKILVKFNHLGYIIELAIVESSGNNLCNKLALQTLKESEPFQNPPKGLITNKVGHMIWLLILN